MLIVRSQNFPKINVDNILFFNIIDIVLLFTHHEKLRVRGAQACRVRRVP